MLKILILLFLFLAVFSSRNDNVTRSVCLSAGSHLYSFEHSKLDVSSVFQECLLGVLTVMKGCSKDAPWKVYTGSFKVV